MSNVQQFIDLIGQGQNAQAQESLNDILSSKAFEALESFKQSVGENLFATEEVEQIDEIFHKVPNTKAAWDYMNKKREVRDDEHKKQDPKMAKYYAKNMVDTAKAAKKANERGIKKDANDFGWQVRNGVQLGKLPEETEQLDEISLNKASDAYASRVNKSFKRNGD